MGEARRSGIGSHHRGFRGATDSWLTPLHVLRELGTFDLDPCACAEAPLWVPALRVIAPPDDGLKKSWRGRVWLNPPYGPDTGTWIEKLAQHGNGIALIFARTETRFFFRSVWLVATAMLFLKGRLTFHRPDGTPSKQGHNSGGPSVLVAYGAANADVLKGSHLEGAFIGPRRVISRHGELFGAAKGGVDWTVL